MLCPYVRPNALILLRCIYAQGVLDFSRSLTLFLCTLVALVAERVRVEVEYEDEEEEERQRVVQTENMDFNF